MKTAEGPPPSGPKLPLDQRVYQLPYNRQYELERDNLEIGNRVIDAENSFYIFIIYALHHVLM